MGRRKLTAIRSKPKRVKLDPDIALLFTPLLQSSRLVYEKETHEIFLASEGSPRLLKTELRMPDIVAEYECGNFYGLLTRTSVLFLLVDAEEDVLVPQSIKLAHAIPETAIVESFCATFDEDRDFGFAYSLQNAPREEKDDDDSERVVTSAGVWLSMFFALPAHQIPHLDQIEVETDAAGQQLRAIEIHFNAITLTLQHASGTREGLVFNAGNINGGILKRFACK